MFLSDFHLGTRGCQAELLLEFLRAHDADTIYLVGDIVDGWRLRKGWYWPQAHNDVVQKLIRHHDAFLWGDPYQSRHGHLYFSGHDIRRTAEQEQDAVPPSYGR